MSERIAENDTGGRDGTLHRTESPQDRRLRGDYWMARLVGGWGGEPTTTQIERPSCLALAGSVLTSGLKSAPIEGQAQVPKNRSEEHTSELQSRLHLVCRLLLEKKKNTPINQRHTGEI